MLEVHNAVCGYGKEIILEDVSLSLNKGEILSILGANGIGKTTLFKSILGHIKLLSGKILLEGKNINALYNVEKAKRIAYVPQAHIPPFPFKVIDVVVMGRTAHIKMFSQPSRLDMEIAEDALRIMNIIDLSDRTYTEISGGERQMVLIARAIAQEAKLLIMDEPMANLDFGNQSRILDQINRLSTMGLSVIYTTHSPEHTFLCSNQVLAIKNRKDYVVGEADKVITNELLKEIYQIEAIVKEIRLERKAIKVCIPVGG